LPNFFSSRDFFFFLIEIENSKLLIFSKIGHYWETNLIKDFFKNKKNFSEKNFFLKFPYLEKKNFQKFFFHSQKNPFVDFFLSLYFFYKKQPFYAKSILAFFFKNLENKRGKFYLKRKIIPENFYFKKNFKVFFNFFFRLNNKWFLFLKNLFTQARLHHISKNFTFFLNLLGLKFQRLRFFLGIKSKKKKKIFWNQDQRLKIDYLNEINFKGFL